MHVESSIIVTRQLTKGYARRFTVARFQVLIHGRESSPSGRLVALKRRKPAPVAMCPRPRTRQGLIAPFALTVIALFFAVRPEAAVACSLVACINGGIDVAGTFDVAIKHDKKPLSGVVIEIKTNTSDSPVVFSGVTDAMGRAHVTKLPAGEYWLSAEFLGIGATYHCFHVDQRPSRKAKRVLAYAWGDFAPATRTVAGKLIDSQPGTGDSPLWNLVNRIDVPIGGAHLRLQNAITNEVFDTTSDSLGAFDFGAARTGTYVLHVEGGQGRAYDPTDLLVKVSDAAQYSALILARQETTCGDVWLNPSFTKSR
jgi:hypothetical protein